MIIYNSGWLFIYTLISTQYHDYISAVYNKPDRLKIARNMSKLRWYKKYMRH